MRIAVFGAGAIGGLIAGRLALAGLDITVIARGANLAALRARGLQLTSAGQTHVIPIRATDDVAEAGPQVAVIAAVKAHALAAAAPDLARLMGAGACLVTAVNGVPYWYFHGLPGPHAGRPVRSVDPDGTLLTMLPPDRVLGCIVYPAADLIGPGEVVHTYGDRLPVGAPDGGRALAEPVAAALVAAGFKAPVRPRVRDDIWLKLWGNLSFNPLSVLTGATLARLATEPGLRAVARAMMTEAKATAEALGARFALDLDRRIDGAAEVGEHRTSMLQDFERGRPTELDALLGAVVELGELAGQPMPTCRTILALTRERVAVRPPALNY